MKYRHSCMVPHLPSYFGLLECNLSLIVSAPGYSQIDLTSKLLKTQFIWFGTPEQLQKLDFAFLSEQFPLISFSSSVRDVAIDSALTHTLPPKGHSSFCVLLNFLYFNSCFCMFSN